MAKFKVGDKVRLSKFNSCENVHWITEKLPYVGTVGFITHCYEEGSYLIMLHDGLRMIWPASALALVNDYDAAVAECKAAIDRAEAAKAELAAVTAERDALQAHIDAGVRVYGRTDYINGGWSEEPDHRDSHTAILLDPQPIADHVPDAKKMVPDPRTGPEDRRVAKYNPSGHLRRKDQAYEKDGVVLTTIQMQRSNTRRRTPGTVADRKQWTRADGSVNERQGERRKSSESKACINGDRVYTLTGRAVEVESDRRDPSGANDRRKGKA